MEINEFVYNINDIHLFIQNYTSYKIIIINLLYFIMDKYNIGTYGFF